MDDFTIDKTHILKIAQENDLSTQETCEDKLDLSKLSKFEPQEEEQDKLEITKLSQFKIQNFEGHIIQKLSNSTLDEFTGSTCKIYLINQYPSKENLILKQIVNEFSQNIFQNEKKILEELSLQHHQNIIKYYGNVNFKNRYSLLLEFCNLGDLFLPINNQLYNKADNINNLSEDECRLIAQHIIKGLDFMHSQNIYHLDIKLENIGVLSKESQIGIKLLDFGTSKKSLCKMYKFDATFGHEDYTDPDFLLSGNLTQNLQLMDVYSVGQIIQLLCYHFIQQSQELQNLIGKMICISNERFNMQQVISHSWLHKQAIVNEIALINKIRNLKNQCNMNKMEIE